LHNHLFHGTTPGASGQGGHRSDRAAAVGGGLGRSAPDVMWAAAGSGVRVLRLQGRLQSLWGSWCLTGGAGDAGGEVSAHGPGRSAPDVLWAAAGSAVRDLGLEGRLQSL